MEAAAAVVSFVGLAGPVAQGLKFLYDFSTNMKDCPKDIRGMRTELELVEELITQVVRQCNERGAGLQSSAALAHTIRLAQESIEDLKKELTAQGAYFEDGKRKQISLRTRIRSAAKLDRTQKLRASLERTKTTMVDSKSQLDSDLLYDIRDTSQEVLRSVKANRSLETYNGNIHEVTQHSEVQAKSTKDSKGGVEIMVQPARDTSSKDLTDIEVMAKKFEHITDLLEETRSLSPPSSMSSTPAPSGGASHIPIRNSSQGMTASSMSSSASVPWSVGQNTPQVHIISKHPLLQFKDNQFQFLVAIIFTRRAKNQHLACQRASECLATYTTPEALANTLAEDLRRYFLGVGLQNVKPPQLIKLAQGYVKDPPQQGRLRLKAKSLPSEISHLPQIGPLSVNTWLVYCCERTDIMTKDKALKEYIEYLEAEARGNYL